MFRAVGALLVAASATVAPCAAETWVLHVDREDGYQLEYPAEMFQPGRRDFFDVTMDALEDGRETDHPVHIFIVWEPEGGLPPGTLHQRLLEKVEQDQIVFDRSTEDAVDLAIVGGFDMTLQYYFHGFGGVMTAYRDVDRASHEELLRRIGRTLRPIDPDAPEGGK